MSSVHVNCKVQVQEPWSATSLHAPKVDELGCSYPSTFDCAEIRIKVGGRGVKDTMAVCDRTRAKLQASPRRVLHVDCMASETSRKLRAACYLHLGGHEDSGLHEVVKSICLDGELFVIVAFLMLC